MLYFSIYLGPYSYNVEYSFCASKGMPRFREGGVVIKINEHKKN